MRQWFAKKDWEIWDKQIKEDSNSGELEFLAKETLHEKNNNGCSPPIGLTLTEKGGTFFAFNNVCCGLFQQVIRDVGRKYPK